MGRTVARDPAAALPQSLGLGSVPWRGAVHALFLRSSARSARLLGPSRAHVGRGRPARAGAQTRFSRLGAPSGQRPADGHAVGALDAQPDRTGMRPVRGQPWIRGTLGRRAPTRSRRPLRAHRGGSRRPQLTPGAHISELGFARDTFPVGSFRNQHPRRKTDPRTVRCAMADAVHFGFRDEGPKRDMCAAHDPRRPGGAATTDAASSTRRSPRSMPAIPAGQPSCVVDLAGDVAGPVSLVGADVAQHRRP